MGVNYWTLPKAGPIHLAFVDPSMPVMDGFETIAALRELWPDLPAIAFSFNNSDQWILKAMHLGARGYIVKTEGNGNPFCAGRGSRCAPTVAT
ncbi:MAG: response regulator [Flavobacteriales bacterium]|nr:response regulator [Flavobacteriales bacterium]